METNTLSANQPTTPAKVSQVLYIAGYGRSGSTLLDTILSNHPRVFGAGEVSHLFREVLKSGPCSCGETVDACPFWRSVRTQAGYGQVTGAELQRIHLMLRQSEKSGSAPVEYGKVWKSLFDAVASESGRDVIVDSSKTATGLRNRPILLTKLCGYDVRVIHLVRDPRAVMWSVNRGSSRKLEAGAKNAKLAGGMLRGAWGWREANHVVDGLKATIDPKKFLLVRYEDFAQDLPGELRRIGDFAGLDYEPLIKAIQAGTSLESGHGVSGNRMRRQGAFELKYDTEWQTALPGYARAVARLMWGQAKSYGYSWQAEGPKELKS